MVGLQAEASKVGTRRQLEKLEAPFRCTEVTASFPLPWSGRLHTPSLAGDENSKHAQLGRGSHTPHLRQLPEDSSNRPPDVSPEYAAWRAPFY